MGFSEEIERYANQLRYGKKKYSKKAIEKALAIMKEYDLKKDRGWTSWNDVLEDFDNEVAKATTPKSKPYRSGRRSSK